METRPVLSGNLGFMSLADIFQILGGNASNGTLRMTSPYAPNLGVIYFQHGDPISASNGDLKGIKAVHSLFGWVEGTFEFQEGDPKVPKGIKEGRMQIVLDALRMLDDGDIKKIGPASLVDAHAHAETVDGEAVVKTIKGPLPDYAYIIEEEEFRGGERIVKEGGHGKWLWVIFDGEVDVHRETPEGPLPVARLGEGCFIGTFAALLFKEYARTATVKAAADVRLGLIDTEQLSTVFNSLSADFRKILLSLDHRLKYVTDCAVNVYTKGAKGKLPPIGNKVVLKKGSSKENLFSVADGNVQIIVPTKKGPLPLCNIQKEDIFGYLPFLDMGHEPRHASVVASENLQVGKISVTGIQNEYDSLPGTFRNLIYVLGNLISYTTRLACRWYEQK